MDDDEERRHSQAVNEVTGEIDWNCPCLKSALEPPCGEAFKEAFECFVKSKTDPKGMDCEASFTKLQNCFAENANHYDKIFDNETRPEIKNEN